MIASTSFRFSVRMLGLGFFILFLIHLKPAFASLGDKETSIEKEADKLQGVHSKAQAPGGYTVHDIAAGTVSIKEYVSKDGYVFAVTWHGNIHPDLSILLGSHFGEFKQMEEKTPLGKGRRMRTVKTSKIVVARGGHMRALEGRAYQPELVPPGVKVEELP
jgi:Protein of unknown function (DUF2844)